MTNERIPKHVLFTWAVMITVCVVFWLWVAIQIDEWLAIPVEQDR